MLMQNPAKLGNALSGGYLGVSRKEFQQAYPQKM
jgi:hypothetical protein